MEISIVIDEKTALAAICERLTLHYDYDSFEGEYKITDKSQFYEVIKSWVSQWGTNMVDDEIKECSKEYLEEAKAIVEKYYTQF